jgi:hypothetical protein
MPRGRPDLRTRRIRRIARAAGSSVLLAVASLGEATPKLPPGTYACGTSCLDKTINGKKCRVCTTTICKKGPRGEELIAGNATETSCEAAAGPRGSVTGAPLAPVQPPVAR